MTFFNQHSSLFHGSIFTSVWILRCYQVNDVSMMGKTQAEVVTMLRNTPQGSVVSMLVSRQEEVDERFTLPRQLVSIHILFNAYIMFPPFACVCVCVRVRACMLIVIYTCKCMYGMQAVCLHPIHALTCQLEMLLISFWSYFVCVCECVCVLYCQIKIKQVYRSMSSPLLKPLP